MEKKLDDLTAAIQALVQTLNKAGPE
ncbi:hypothetical protein [Neomoorella humiferrea]